VRCAQQATHPTFCIIIQKNFSLLVIMMLCYDTINKFLFVNQIVYRV